MIFLLSLSMWIERVQPISVFRTTVWFRSYILHFWEEGVLLARTPKILGLLLRVLPGFNLRCETLISTIFGTLEFWSCVFSRKIEGREVLCLFLQFFESRRFEKQDWQDFRRFGCFKVEGGRLIILRTSLLGPWSVFLILCSSRCNTLTHHIYLVNYFETQNIIEEGRGRRLLLRKFNGS